MLFFNNCTEHKCNQRIGKCGIKAHVLTRDLVEILTLQLSSKALIFTPIN